MHYKQSKKILEKIRMAKKVLINCHRRPDPDSVSSALATQCMLKDMGIDSLVVSPDPIPSFLSFLPNVNNIVVTDLDNFDYSTYDLFLILDSPTWDFITGNVQSVSPKGLFKIQIDHHIKRNKFTDLSLIEENVSSTAEVLYLLFEDWKLAINSNTANALLSGIIGDTLCFKIPATTARTLKIAAELIELGADRQHITNNLFSRMKFDLVKFMGEVMNRLEKDEEHGFVWSAIPYEVFNAFKKPPGAKNNTANMFFGSIDEGDFGILMVEEKKGNLLVSLRSANRFDVSEIAKELGGGGHRDSSATLLRGIKFDKAVNNVLHTARKYANKKESSN